jgi:hypothetical protein
MRANYFFWVLLALIAGLLAAMLTHQFMTRNQEPPVATKPTVPMFIAEVVPIVVAAIPTPGNILIDDPGRWFRVIRMAKGDAPPDGFAEFGPLRGLHLKRPLSPYQPVLRSDVESRPPAATTTSPAPSPAPEVK